MEIDKRIKIQITQAPRKHPERSNVRPWYAQHINKIFCAVVDGDGKHFQIAEWDSPYNKNYVDINDAIVVS